MAIPNQLPPTPSQLRSSDHNNTSNKNPKFVKLLKLLAYLFGAAGCIQYCIDIFTRACHPIINIFLFLFKCC